MQRLIETNLNTVEYSRNAYDEMHQTMSFRSKTRLETEIWQRELRPVVADLIAKFPNKSCDLLPRVVEVRDFPSYIRETVLFQSRLNMSVYGYFLRPKRLNAQRPAILCLHGHGRGVDDLVGIRKDGNMRVRYGGYQRDFALQCVNRGYTVLAIEQLGFGRRRDEAAFNAGPRQSSCQPAAGAALLLGQTMIGWRVWDAMCALDYMQTREEVDQQRMAVMGISGGGTTAFFLAALERRPKAAVVSGYFNTFQHSILSVSHCMDNYIPGILRYVEMYDIAGLIAPRALFVESGDGDQIFPVEGTRFAVRRAEEIFRVLGARNNIRMEVFRGPHQFHGVGAFKFLSRVL